jgi:hypothetical protein
MQSRNSRRGNFMLEVWATWWLNRAWEWEWVCNFRKSPSPHRKTIQMILKSVKAIPGKATQWSSVRYKPTAVAHAKLERHVWNVNISVSGLQPGRTGSLPGPGDALGGRACPGGTRLLPRDGHRSAGWDTPCGGERARYRRRLVQVPRRFPGFPYTKLVG